MIKPALLYKDRLEKKFAEFLYTKEYYFYNGYEVGSMLPNIRQEENLYQYAIVDNDDNLLGYFSYKVDPLTRSAYGIGAFSFVKGSYIVGRDYQKLIKNLVKTYHRVTWTVIEGNPAFRSYNRLLNFYRQIPYIKTHLTVLHDTTVDKYGDYYDEIIYEIINRGNC